MYSAYQSDQSAFSCPVYTSCSPCAWAARRKCLGQIAHAVEAGQHPAHPSRSPDLDLLQAEALERSVRVKLFECDRRRAGLNAAGRQLLPDARELLAARQQRPKRSDGSSAPRDAAGRICELVSRPNRDGTASWVPRNDPHHSEMATLPSQDR
jgi:hypothetical protein